MDTKLEVTIYSVPNGYGRQINILCEQTIKVADFCHFFSFLRFTMVTIIH